MPLKRPPRRGRKHSLASTPALGAAALKDVRRAHNLIERGDHENAAHLFEHQARDAADHGKYLAAAHLFLQGGRARLLAGETKISELLLRQGLEILTKQANPKRLKLSSDQLIEDLLRIGQAQLAEYLRSLIEQASTAKQTTGLDIVDHPQPKGKFRTQCPHCNAILRPADIEPWDAAGNVCVYCGNLIADEEIA
jgi:hypothetical protein